ncbi:MAG: D-alanine--D-alanine ligase, partial [Bacteroidaceae bacterium]|nr:D-alanine--D-alanine ligase [Bacteroidaceae bacterium]
MGKKNIAVIAGGDSSEFAVSLKSAEGIFSFLDKEKYNVFVALLSKKEWKVKIDETNFSPIDKNDFSFNRNGEKIKFDFAY